MSETRQGSTGILHRIPETNPPGRRNLHHRPHHHQHDRCFQPCRCRRRRRRHVASQLSRDLHRLTARPQARGHRDQCLIGGAARGASLSEPRLPAPSRLLGRDLPARRLSACGGRAAQQSQLRGRSPTCVTTANLTTAVRARRGTTTGELASLHVFPLFLSHFLPDATTVRRLCPGGTT